MNAEPEFDPAMLTRAEREKIAKRARRSVGSEVSLILGFGFAVAMVVQFFFTNYSFLPLANLLLLRPTLVWISLSMLFSIVFSFVHGWLARGVVARARKQQYILYKFDEAKKRAEIERKIIEMQEKA